MYRWQTRKAKGCEVGVLVKPRDDAEVINSDRARVGAPREIE